MARKIADSEYQNDVASIQEKVVPDEQDGVFAEEEREAIIKLHIQARKKVKDDILQTTLTFIKEIAGHKMITRGDIEMLLLLLPIIRDTR